MGVLKLRATGLKRDLEKMSTFLYETSDDSDEFELLSESEDYPSQMPNKFKRFFLIDIDSELMDETD